MDKLYKRAESDIPTPYAVKCWTCSNGELIYMNYDFYMDQLLAADSKWKCPRCFSDASWSDENYEKFNSDNIYEYHDGLEERKMSELDAKDLY